VGAVEYKNTIGKISGLFEKLKYEHALEEIQRARGLSMSTSALVTLSLYEGILWFEMGKLEESEEAFQVALMLRPNEKLPDQVVVSPKVEAYFEDIRKKVQQEMLQSLEAHQGAGTSGTPSAPSSREKVSSKCASTPIEATGRTLKAQQLWRLASMEQMLCARGIPRSAVSKTMEALKDQLSHAGTITEWVRVSQEINQFAHQFAVYPSTEDWLQAKSSVSEDLWEVGDEDQDVPLPEAPVAAVNPPANLFGCRAAVAAECERLMMRLIALQGRTTDMDEASRSTALRALFQLGQKVREADSSKLLEDVSRDIDAWAAKSREASPPVAAKPL
jgi:tetratricopeptide (TPR) repeat protein